MYQSHSYIYNQYEVLIVPQIVNESDKKLT